MNLAELLESVNMGEVLANGGLILLVVLTVVQISPIKINPWSWFAKQIGRAINGEVIRKMESLEKEVGSLRDYTTEQSIINCRVRILQFGDELLRNVKHSKNGFDQTLHDIDEYERYCAAHPDFKNNVTVMTVQRIKAVYNELLTTGDFL